MEFLKTLALEADRLIPVESDTTQCPDSPPTCALSTPLDALHMAVVMEMLADELETLSTTVSAPQPELRTAESIRLDKRTHRPTFTLIPKSPKHPRRYRRFSLEQHYSSVIPRRMLQGLVDISFWSPADLRDLMAEAKIRTDTAGGKYQMDRTFALLIADNTLRELLQTGTFTTLYKTIMEEKEKLRKFWKTCVKITQDQILMTRLKKELMMIREEKRVKVKELGDEIFRLNDQTLELNKRIQLEQRLVEKQVHMTVKRFKRRHRQVVSENHHKLQAWQLRVKLEERAHYQMVVYLKQVVKERHDLMNYWNDKYETDLTVLTTALEEMQAQRYKDTLRFEYITRVIRRHEPIVLEERRLKLIVADKQKREKREHWAAVKVQAWWRGTMVRNELGPFRRVIGKPNKKDAKDAEDKGGKGGKGKKK